MAEATSLLTAAIAGEDVPKLEEAIAHAKTLDVDTSEGLNASSQLRQAQADKLEALAALEKVCEGEDLDAIDAALAKASEKRAWPRMHWRRLKCSGSRSSRSSRRGVRRS